MRVIKRVKAMHGVVALLALALAVALVYALSGGFLATAHVPDKIEPALGGGAQKPAVETNFKVTNLTKPGKSIGYGDQVKYEGSLQLKNAEVGGTLEITVSLNRNAAALDAPLTPANLQWSKQPASVSGPVQKGGGWVYTAEGVAPGTSVNFSATAHVAESEDTPGAEPGTMVFGSLKGVYMPVGFTSDLTLSPSGPAKPVLFANGSCYAVLKSVSNELDRGAWLADIKFGELSDQPQIRFVNDKFAYGTGQPQLSTDASGKVVSTPDTIAFEIPGENAQTATTDILEQAKFYAHDDSFPSIVKLPAEQEPKAHFSDSLNWPFDASKMTGKVWIPKGTKITIQRAFEVPDCVSATFSAAVQKVQLMYYVQLGVPNLPATGTANAVFTLPGLPSGVSECNAVYWQAASLDKFGASPMGDFVRLLSKKPTANGVLGYTTTQGKPGDNLSPVSSGSLAISPKFPERLYYIAGDKKLYYLDTNTKEHVWVGPGVAGTPDLFNGNQDRTPVSAGFDKDGVLWAWALGNKGNSAPKQHNMALWSIDVNNPKARWQQRVVFSGDVYSKTFYDLAFDEAGNIYALGGAFSSIASYGAAGRNMVFIPADVWKPHDLQNGGRGTLDIDSPQIGYQPMNLVQPGNGTNINNGSSSVMYGIAFGPGGTLWGAFGPSDSSLIESVLIPSIGRIDTTQIKPGSKQTVDIYPSGVWNKQNQAVSTPKGAFPYMFTDLGSCAALDVDTVEKSVVDPVTGEVMPAGTAAENGIEMVDNNVTIDINGQPTRIVEGKATFKVTVRNGAIVNSYNPDGSVKGRVIEVSDQLNLGNSSFYIHNLTVDGKPAVTKDGKPVKLDQNSVEFFLKSNPLAAQQSQTFEIVADLISTDITSSNLGNIGQCDMSVQGNGQFGDDTKGVFNRVQSYDSSTGRLDPTPDKTNQACVPVKPKDSGNLYVYKGILNADGSQNAGAFHQDGAPEGTKFVTGDRAKDVTRFLFNVSGPTPYNEAMSEVAGNSSAPWKPVGGPVVSGTYQLNEGPADGTIATGYKFGNRFDCYQDGKTTPLATSTTSVSVPKGATVRCYVANKPNVPQFHVEKLATDPDATYPAHAVTAGSPVDSHIGKAVTADANGNVAMKYTIVVTNDSRTTADSGAVMEYFKVPAGLRWQNGQNATVKYTGPNGSQAVGLQGSYSQAQFTAAQGLQLAAKVTNLPSKGSAKFEITIPLQIDPATFAANEQTLGSCSAQQANGLPGYVTDTEKGVGNTTAIAEEWEYNANWKLDNVACIPVKQNAKVDFVLRKMDAAPAASGMGLKGAEFKICNTQPTFVAGVLDAKLTDGATPACVPLQTIDQVAGSKLADATEARWAAAYDQYGQAACSKYLPAGVTPTYKERYKYGAAFSACINSYAAVAASTDTLNTDGSLFWAQDLKPNQPYWIVETKAPLCDDKAAKGDNAYCYSLLPEPVQVSIAADGTISSGKNAGTCNPFTDSSCTPQAANVGSFDIYQNAVVAHDPRQAQLPKAGGSGPLPWAIGGTLALLGAAGYLGARYRRRA